MPLKSKYFTVHDFFALFKDIDFNTNMPWANDVAYSNFNGLDIYLTRSGYKVVNPTVRDMFIGTIIHNVNKKWINLTLPYANKWRRLWDSIENSTYNPIENFNGVEEINDTTTHVLNTIHNDSTTYGSKTNTNNSDTLTHNTTDTMQGSATTENFVNGWNSGTSAPQANDLGTSDSTSTKTGTDINATVGEQTKTGTDTDTLKVTGTNTDTYTHKLTKSGNLGVTTSQQMLESEIELRKKMIIDIVFSDIDTILTIPYQPLDAIPNLITT